MTDIEKKIFLEKYYKLIITLNSEQRQLFADLVDALQKDTADKIKEVKESIINLITIKQI